MDKKIKRCKRCGMSKKSQNEGGGSCYEGKEHIDILEEKKCELYLDHNVVWGGDGFYCSICGIEFIPNLPQEPNSDPNPNFNQIIKNEN